MRRRTRLSLFLAPIILGLLATGPIVGQQAKPTSNEESKSEASVKFRGRLPAYFAAVVTQKQRETIYEIQARVQAQILRLQQQIEQLEATRDEDVDGVLDPDHLEHVKKKRMAAEQRLRARSRPGGNANPGGENASSAPAS